MEHVYWDTMKHVYWSIMEQIYWDTIENVHWDTNGTCLLTTLEPWVMYMEYPMNICFVDSSIPGWILCKDPEDDQILQPRYCNVTHYSRIQSSVVKYITVQYSTAWYNKLGAIKK